MTVVDINIHHLPEDLFTNEKILNGFLNSAPRGFGEIASVAMKEIQSPEIMECVQQTMNDPKATSLIQQLTSAPEVSNLLGSFGGSIPGLPAAEEGPK